MGGVTVMGVVASEIEADEVVTLPTMISHKHPQGGPRPPDVPLQELTQELTSGTKQLCYGVVAPFDVGGEVPCDHRTLPYCSTSYIGGTLPYHTKFYVRNYWYCLFVLVLDLFSSHCKCIVVCFCCYVTN